MDEALKNALSLFRDECQNRFGERLQKSLVVSSNDRILMLIVVDELTEREQYRLYRDAAGFALKNRRILLVFPYSSNDARRREDLAFIKRFSSEGEES